MVGKISAALVAALVLGSAGVASARTAWDTRSERAFAPTIKHYDGWTRAHGDERCCYMPSSPCDNNHRMTN